MIFEGVIKRITQKSVPDKESGNRISVYDILISADDLPTETVTALSGMAALVAVTVTIE